MIVHMKETCDEKNCDRMLYAKGLCRMHYQRFNRTGTTKYRPNKGGRKPAPRIRCDVCGEMRRHRARGMCDTCYNKWYWQQTRDRWREDVWYDVNVVGLTIAEAAKAYGKTEETIREAVK